METLRPNGVGDEENIETVVGGGVGTHWAAVDEVVADDNTSYVGSNEVDYERDLYNLGNLSVTEGIISQIIAYGRFRHNTDIPDMNHAKICLKVGEEVLESYFQCAAANTFENFSVTYTENPVTHRPWTVSDINSLQLGCACKRGKTGAANQTRCTQIYIEAYLESLPETSLKYIIEVHDSAGDLIAFLPLAHGIKLVEAIHDPPGLIFRVPADDNTAYYTQDYQFWLRNYQTQVILCKFRFVGREDIRGGEHTELVIEVSVAGRLSQLADELITSYDTGATPHTVETIAQELLDFQINPVPITLGIIEIATTTTFDLEDGSILAAFYKLRDIVGGYIEVNNGLELNWYEDIGEDKGQQIRYGKNLQNISKTTDPTQLTTKLYPRGTGIDLLDLDVTQEEAEKDADAGHGYLTLGGEYSCYQGWTAEGAALPGHITVTEQLAASWITPTGHTDPSVSWNMETWAYDDDNDTFANEDIAAFSEGNYLHLTLGAAITCNAIRFDAYFELLKISRITIDVSPDGVSWTNVYAGWYPPSHEWVEVEFASQQVKEARIKFRNSSPDAQMARFYEFDFRQEGADVTVDWEQGEDERTIRCDIGDYDPAATYLLDYTHAEYLKAWDTIDTYGEIRRIFKFTTSYTDQLIAAARLKLDDLKNPLYYYDISLFDLSTLAGRDFEQLMPGSIVTVIDEELDIDVETRIVKVTHPDLLQPHLVQIEVSTQLKEILDVLIDIKKQL